MDVSSWTGMADDAAFVNALLQQALEAVKEVMGENAISAIHLRTISKLDHLRRNMPT